MRITPWIAACLATSWLCFGIIAIAGLPSPTKTIGNSQTDLQSHWGSAVLFLDHGFDIYKHPIRELCLPPSQNDLAFAESHALNPADICKTASQRADGEPIFINWSQYPRPYPPGVLLYSAPEAALYLWTSIPFESINLLSVIKFLAVMHLTMAAFLFTFFAQPTKKGITWTFEPFAGFILMPMIFSVMLLWAMHGVYDPISLLSLLLSVWFLRAKNPSLAVLFLSAAIFLHFRALWWAALFVPCFLQLRRADLRKFSVQAPLHASALLLGIAGTCFLLIYPELKTFAVSNPQYFPLVAAEPAQRFFYFAFPLVFLLAYLGWLRCWLLLGTVGWQLFMVLNTPEVRSWHILFVFPMFAIAMLEPKEKRLHALIACFALFLLEAVSVFGGSFPLHWEILSFLFKL